MAKKRNHIEHDIQVNCINWYRETFPEGLIFAVPNCGVRNIGTYYYLIAEGLMKGAPDLVATRPDGSVVFIEMKAPNGRLSDSQKEIMEKCMSISENLYVVVKNVEEFMQVFEA